MSCSWVSALFAAVVGGRVFRLSAQPFSQTAADESNRPLHQAVGPLLTWKSAGVLT